jgi:hypothetical protein
MPRQPEKLTLTWLLKHPLVATCILLALTIALPYLRVGERLKLLTFLPVAHASSDVEKTPYNELSEDERIRVDLAAARELLTKLEGENSRLRQAVAQMDALREVGSSFAESILPSAVNAQVIFKGDASNWRQACWINRGKKHGIEEDSTGPTRAM